VPVVGLRYFTVYGPRQRPDMAIHRLIEAGLGRGRFSLFGDGSQVRDFTYVADVVDATVRAARADITPGTIYNVAGGSEISLAGLIDIIAEHLGNPIPIDRGPEHLGDVQRTGGDVTAAATELNWNARTSLHDGLLNQIAWHRSRR
jgi:nucleoside-diphosphate-sugar epimerase